MTPRERVEAVLNGHQPDRPPLSLWHHFPPDQTTGQPAVDAHLRFLDTYKFDFLKVMNDHPYPRGRLDVIRTVDDLRKLAPLPGDAGGFADQLAVLRALRRRLGPDMLMSTTVFNPWTVLRQFTAAPPDHHTPPRLDGCDERDDLLGQLLKQDYAAVQAALEAITETLSAFARACLEAGADGIFFSVRDDWVDRPENETSLYSRLVRPLDLRVLSHVRAADFNILHVCGRAVTFDAFAAYPAQVLNWADRAAGPSISSVRDRVQPAIAGGLDNLGTMLKGTPRDCMHEVRDALHQAGRRPIILAPGCTFDPDAVPTENLQAIVNAARA